MRICVLVNGPAQKTKGVRVRELFRDLMTDHEVTFHYRDDRHKWKSTRAFLHAVRTASPDIIFVEGVAYAGVLAALAGRVLHGSRIVLSTGDAAYALAKSFMNPFKAHLMGVIEFTALRMANVIIAKGQYHKELLEHRGFRNVFWIPDGVDASSFKPLDVRVIRGRLGLDKKLTIGVVGSLVLNRKHQFCYGWEIVEVLRLLKDLPVVGIIVGEGDGVPFLKTKATEYGIADRLVFTGWIDHDLLPKYVNMIDICVSTQSNDLVGQVRTTAKLPEYLACGRYVIASDVGGAKTFVAGSGMLLPYEGIKDIQYVEELAGSVRRLCADRSLLQIGENGVETAKRYFDYSVLRHSLAGVVESLQPPNTLHGHMDQRSARLTGRA